MNTNRASAVGAILLTLMFAPLASPVLGAVGDEPVDVKQELAALAKRYAIEIDFELLEFLVQTLHGVIHGGRGGDGGVVFGDG